MVHVCIRQEVIPQTDEPEHPPADAIEIGRVQSPVNSKEHEIEFGVTDGHPVELNV